MERGNYKKMALMLVVSFVVMYTVMFLNVDSMDHVYLSLTRMYMSLLMVTPMALLMMGLMGKMYPHRKLNAIIAVSALTVFILTLVALRNQAFISDKQYMHAMIPHHSSAILTSKNAAIRDTEVDNLAKAIIESQEREIREMKQMLQGMED